MVQWREHGHSTPTDVAWVRFWPSAIYGLSLLLVFTLAICKGFSASSPVFFPLQKPTSTNSNLTKIDDPYENKADLAFTLNMVTYWVII